MAPSTVNAKFTGNDPIKSEVLSKILCEKCCQEPDFWVRNADANFEIFYCAENEKLLLANYAVKEDQVLIVDGLKREALTAHLEAICKENFERGSHLN